MSLRQSIVALIIAGAATALQAVPSDAAFTDLDGKAFDIKTDKNTRLIMVWATWCTTCRQKLRGELQELSETSDVSFFSINIDEDIARAKKVVAKDEIKVAVLREPQRKIETSFNITSVPYWLVYKRDSAESAWKLIANDSGWDRDKIAKALGRKYPIK